MAEVRDWKGMRDMMVRLLEERTGEGLDQWNQKIKRQGPKDAKVLQSWLEKQGVTGYARSLLMMETFGYPDYLLASATRLVDQQYRDRLQLRPIYDALIAVLFWWYELSSHARTSESTSSILQSPTWTFIVSCIVDR